MTDKIQIDRTVVEQALEALFMYKPMVTGVTFQHGMGAMQALRAALEQPKGEQEPAPNGATHRQPKQGAFYKRVDGKWYVWSRMENGEPHRWYISPGTSESCLEPLNAAAPQPPAVKDSLTAEQPQSVTDCHQSQPKREPLTDAQINDHRLALPYDGEDLPDPWDFKQGVRAAERAHGIGDDA